MKKYLFILFALLLIILPCFSYADETSEHQKSSWYIGFGIGSGQGRIEKDSFSSYFDSVGEKYGDTANKGAAVTINFGVGGIINDNFHLGFEGSALRQTAKYNIYGSSSEITLQINNYLLAATYYPFETGFSLKGGLGFSALQVSNSGYFSGSKTYGGSAFLIGLGYDFWLGETFNLGLHMDFSKQYYRNSDAPKDTGMLNIYLSFYWF